MAHSHLADSQTWERSWMEDAWDEPKIGNPSTPKVDGAMPRSTASATWLWTLLQCSFAIGRRLTLTWRRRDQQTFGDKWYWLFFMAARQPMLTSSSIFFSVMFSLEFMMKRTTRIKYRLKYPSVANVCVAVPGHSQLTRARGVPHAQSSSGTKFNAVTLNCQQTYWTLARSWTRESSNLCSLTNCAVCNIALNFEN